ncbi:ATP-binding protein [bacterium]|nr:ATP-binding protein [bacterium]
MSSEITEILQSFKDQVFTFSSNQIGLWMRELDNVTSNSIDLLIEAVAELSSLIEDHKPQYDLWETLHSLLDSLFTETAKWNYPDRNASTAIIYASLQEDLIRIISNQELQIVIGITDDYYRPLETDDYKTLAWKFYKRLSIKLSEQLLASTNLVRKLFHKDIKQRGENSRTVLIHQFLDYNLKVPLTDFIIDEWQRYLFNRFGLINELSATLNTLINEIIPSSADDVLCTPVDQTKTKSLLQSLKNILGRFQVEKNIDSESYKDFVTSFEKLWEKLTSDIEEKWNYAGTAVYSENGYNTDKFTEELTKIEARAVKSISAWNYHQSGIRDEWRKDIELSILRIEILQICHNTAETIENKISNKIIPVFEKTGDVITKALMKFNQPSSTDHVQLRDSIIQENRRLLNDLRKENLPKMIDVVVKANIESDLKNYLSSVRTVFKGLSEKHTIFTHKDTDNNLPKSKTDVIPLKELAYIELYLKLQEPHDELLQFVQDKLNIIIRSISEIDQIVEYNLEAALNLLEESSIDSDLEKPKQVVAEGLERTLGQIEEIKSKISKIQEFSSEQLHGITIGFQRRLRELLDNKEILELKIRLTRAKAREQFISYRKHIWSTLKGMLPSVVKGMTFIGGFIREHIFRIRRLTGLTVPTVRLEDVLINYLSESEKKITNLPYVYKRLFRTEPLNDERFFDGRSEEIAILKKQLQNWRNSYFTNTVFVGEKGTGKTTLLNLSESILFKGNQLNRFDIDSSILSLDELVLQLSLAFGMDETSDVEILTERLLNGEPRICIIENLHNIYIRVVGGFDTLKQILLLISKTGDKIFWITSCSIYSWQYLDRVMNISAYFNKIIYLDALVREEIENIVMRRHRVSGYEHHFNLPDDNDKVRKYRKLSTEEAIQRALHDDFFDDLSDLANGNISVAIQYYLRAIDEVKEDRIMISPLDTFDYTTLFQLTPDDLFSLAAILQHGELSEGEHARIFHQETSTSCLLLKRMRNSGVLIEESGRYKVHPLMYRPVVRALKSRNILH